MYIIYIRTYNIYVYNIYVYNSGAIKQTSYVQNCCFEKIDKNCLFLHSNRPGSRHGRDPGAGIAISIPAPANLQLWP